uniref:Uncharacterized protein n=1 Tax=Magallana gigas TaxID=29159 RepID=A0A8W8JED7_MAGGI
MGKHTCPSLNGTEQLYSGTADGSFYTYKQRGGTNTLCLPHHPEPVPDNFPFVFQDNNKENVEYLRRISVFLKGVVLQDDVPSSVCRAKLAFSSMMIPAKRSYPSGWTKQ